MVYSMSGFGRGDATFFSGTGKEVSIHVEMKSVNSRSCDITIKSASKYSFLEEWVRAEIRDSLVRGKVDFFLYVSGAKDGEMVLDFDVLDKYDSMLKQIERRYKLNRTRDASEYLKAEGAVVYKRNELDEAGFKAEFEPAAKAAIQELLSMRELEGRHLAEDIAGKLRELLGHLDAIEKLRQTQVEKKFEMLKQKISELIGSSVDEQLILQEAAIFAEKVDIEEEVVRLRTHIEHMERLLKDGGVIGRKMDFIAQELLREVNTIGSKSPDENIVAEVVEMKSVIGRIKEQVQNIL